ncbi:hypothetical protein CAC42_3659 [Sphaceloma murrayae]|uniref:Uncharacterized protein n=1 Tax=Sphaceloma murrayae TaxID=2082308 RepID=A0A2K1QQ49_9PEZI|nr:hypothetical protein CAC42_3659 [Sphaceloma murrayae]
MSNTSQPPIAVRSVTNPLQNRGFPDPIDSNDLYRQLFVEDTSILPACGLANHASQPGGPTNSLAALNRPAITRKMANSGWFGQTSSANSTLESDANAATFKTRGEGRVSSGASLI